MKNRNVTIKVITLVFEWICNFDYNALICIYYYIIGKCFPYAMHKKKVGVNLIYAPLYDNICTTLAKKSVNLCEVNLIK